MALDLPDDGEAVDGMPAHPGGDGPALRDLAALVRRLAGGLVLQVLLCPGALGCVFFHKRHISFRR